MVSLKTEASNQIDLERKNFIRIEAGASSSNESEASLVEFGCHFMTVKTGHPIFPIITILHKLSCVKLPIYGNKHLKSPLDIPPSNTILHKFPCVKLPIHGNKHLKSPLDIPPSNTTAFFC
eukprot:g78867.t1